MTRSSLGRALIAGLWATWMACAGPALAQDDPGGPDALAFRPVEGGEVEDVDGGALMVAAYGVIFVLLLGYVLYLARIQAGTTAELARLRAALEKQRGYRAPAPIEPADAEKKDAGA